MWKKIRLKLSFYPFSVHSCDSDPCYCCSLYYELGEKNTGDSENHLDSAVVIPPHGMLIGQYCVYMLQRNVTCPAFMAYRMTFVIKKTPPTQKKNQVKKINK